MDAKPQRALRPQVSFYQPSNENIAPAMANGYHQRHKSIGATVTKDSSDGNKLNTKRTAFGDVSNVLRNLPAPGYSSLKVNNSIVNAASVYPIVGDKENTAQKAGFLAPAQRPKLAAPGVVPISTAQNSIIAPEVGKTHAGATRKTTVVFSIENEVVRASASVSTQAALLANDVSEVYTQANQANTSKIVKSPRHYKSQPCLKIAESLQQQTLRQALRRTQSRLPVDRSQFKDASFLPLSAEATALPESDAPSECEFHDAKEVHFVDAIEEPQNLLDKSLVEAYKNMVPAHSKDTVEVQTEQHPGALSEDIGFLQSIAAEMQPFSTSISAPSVGNVASECEEPWDEDADFYDEQGYTTAHSFRSFGDNTTGGFTTIMMPKVTAKIQDELDLARSIVESSISPEEIEDESWDVSMVAEYAEDINNYMRELEAKMLPNSHYMDMQTEIQWSMRSVLMEWLIEVHARFDMMPETLFLAINYIDRFLSSKIVSVNKLQLVGATALFIAAKYEEIMFPCVEEIAFMVNGGYTTEEILKAERFMLSMLGFELGWPGPMSFLRRISKADDFDVDTRTLAKYFLEVTAMDERFVGCPASFLAAGSHCVARMMLGKGDWSMAHTHYSGYTWGQIRPLANAILYCCRDSRTHHAVVYKKYSSSKFRKASLFVEEELREGFSLPPIHFPRCQSSFTSSTNAKPPIGSHYPNYEDALL